MLLCPRNCIATQGITKAGPNVEDPAMMTRLWTHEVLRVFYDRLVDDADRQWMGRTLGGLLERHFKERLVKVLSMPEAAAAGGAEPSPEAVLTALRTLMFADFLVPGADPRVYGEVKDQAAMQRVVMEYLADFNATSKKPMNLVIFQFALEHIARICRVITSPGGNALLVGVGGSGRQSLTRLAAFIEEYEVYQIEISKTYSKTEWHEDLKKVGTRPQGWPGGQGVGSGGIRLMQEGLREVQQGCLLGTPRTQWDLLAQLSYLVTTKSTVSCSCSRGRA